MVGNSVGRADLRQVDQKFNFRHVISISVLAIQLLVFNYIRKEVWARQLNADGSSILKN